MASYTKSPAKHRVAISGSSGRMGQALLKAMKEADDFTLTHALDVQGSANVANTAKSHDLSDTEYFIDFTRPTGTMYYLDVCSHLNIKMVIGTTGFNQKQKQRIAELAKKTAIVMAPNMSIGVNVTLGLVALAAKNLQQGYDVEIVETHHKHKVDAPSGTALKMGEVIAQAQNKTLEEYGVYERYGHIGTRKPGSIGFTTLRGGDVVGDHKVCFLGEGERIEITHQSGNRNAYAQGSLQAVRFLADKTTGLYDMFDVLGLR